MLVLLLAHVASWPAPWLSIQAKLVNVCCISSTYNTACQNDIHSRDLRFLDSKVHMFSQNPTEKLNLVSRNSYNTLCKPPICLLQDLADKIAQLNSAIDDVSSQLKASDAVEEASIA